MVSEGKNIIWTLPYLKSSRSFSGQISTSFLLLEINVVKYEVNHYKQIKILMFFMKFCAVLLIRIRNPLSVWPLDPGSWMGKKSGSGTRIINQHPWSYYLEFINHLLDLKYLKILHSWMRMKDAGLGCKKFWSGIRVWKSLNLDPESGKNIPDPQHVLPVVQ